MPPTLLLLSAHAPAYARELRAADLAGLSVLATTDPAEARVRGQDCELALGEPNLLRQVIQQLPALRWVQATWAGVEPLLDPALRRDYTLTNARGVFGEAMTEYVLAYLLAHERRVFERHAAQQAARWDNTPTGALRGKRLGLLGVGSIGSHIAQALKPFGLTLYGYTQSSESCPAIDRYFHDSERLAFASALDYLVSILPNTAATRHVVDAALLKALPVGAVFINVGRGSAVETDALVSALISGHLARAVLDVFEQEPLPPEHIFWRTPNLHLTAHTAAPSTPAAITAVFADNYGRWTRGEPLRHVVDFERGY